MGPTPEELLMALTLNDIQTARRRIRDHIHATPVVTSATLNEHAGAQLFFKCENLQKAGAFKARGATNAVLALSDEECRRGVVTHSSGNHAGALSRAARIRGVPAYVVMPNTAPKMKQAAVRRYGGEVVLSEPTLEDRERAARQLMETKRAVLIHPYDDFQVMAGQGTTALEFLEQMPELDLLLCPVGGGGLLSGVAVAGKSIKPTLRILGVEPANADDAARSLAAGRILPSVHPNTIADGLRSSLGERPFAEIQRLVDGIVTVSEAAIIDAMRALWEVLKLVVEPSGAVAYAAIRERADRYAGQRIGIVLSGGNLDLDTLPWQKQA